VRSRQKDRRLLVPFAGIESASEVARRRQVPPRGRATQKWRGVKNSKKAARSLRTRTAARSVSHAGPGETRFPAADGLGRPRVLNRSRDSDFPKNFKHPTPDTRRPDNLRLS
jgi:hypothetical protein